MQPGKALNRVRERAAAAAAAAAETAAAAAGAAMIVATGTSADASVEECARQCGQPSDADELRQMEEELPEGTLPDAQVAAMTVAV